MALESWNLMANLGSFVQENLGYLSISQTLADYAMLVRHLQVWLTYRWMLRQQHVGMALHKNVGLQLITTVCGSKMVQRDTMT